MVNTIVLCNAKTHHMAGTLGTMPKQPQTQFLNLLIMRLIFAILLTLSLLSCDMGNDYYAKGIDIVRINNIEIPDTSYYPDIVNIKAQAVAEDGCWRDLHFIFEKKAEFVYTIKALGTYEIYGPCPGIMVYQDTIIEFRPSHKGRYKFQILEYKNKTVEDSLYVK